jgi:proteasome lid subunit RPN8/RPN11
MIARLILPEDLRTQLVREAERSFPRECCGLIEGILAGDMAQAFALHPCANLAREPDRFEIDPRDHIKLLRQLRGTPRSLIGCYHSHPNGQAAASARDAQGASGNDFLWLIQAVGSDGAGELGVFVFGENRFQALCVSERC